MSFFDTPWCEAQEPGADALRLLFRMGDPDDGLECLALIPDLFHERVLYRLGRVAVKRRRRFLVTPRGGWIFLSTTRDKKKENALQW